jgi:hypothetical protein
VPRHVGREFVVGGSLVEPANRGVDGLGVEVVAFERTEVV